MMKLSVVIVTYNETAKLVNCLKSVTEIASEIIIIDLGSSDGLDKVLLNKNIKLLRHSYVTHVELVRNLAISKAICDWVLILDPDEIVPVTLGAKITDLVTQSEYVAINIPRKNIFFGKWVSHTNFWPDRQIRLVRKNSVSWPAVIHSYPKIKGSILNLPAQPEFALNHYGFDNLTDFFERHNRYSSVLATEINGKKNYTVW